MPGSYAHTHTHTHPSPFPSPESPCQCAGGVFYGKVPHAGTCLIGNHSRLTQISPCVSKMSGTFPCEPLVVLLLFFDLLVGWRVGVGLIQCE